jgi:outer membrane protein TolC
MRRALSVVLILAATTAGAAAAEAPLTLPEVLREALEANPRQSVQRLEVDKAEQARQAARGARWPSLDLNASATRYGYPTFVHGIRELGRFPPLDDTIYDYGVALKLPLYTGGKIEQGVTLAELGKDIAAERERLGAQELTFNAASVYLKILHLARLERAYDARIASLEAQEKRVALLVQVGRAPRLDALKINVQLSKARHDRLQIENRRKEARTLLYNLLGRTAPAAEAPLASYAPGTEPAWELDALKRSAHERRPELKIAEQEVATGEAQVQSARAERLPNVSIVGSYHERAGVDTEYFDDWGVGVQLSLPLADGGVRRARTGQAAVAAEQARAVLTERRLEVDKQVQDAWDAHAEAMSRMRVTERSVAEAEEALAIEKLKYEQGVGVITDLLNAESALLAAQADRLQAEFDLIIARLSVLKASGALDPQGVMTLVAAREEQPLGNPAP